MAEPSESLLSSDSLPWEARPAAVAPLPDPMAYFAAYAEITNALLAPAPERALDLVVWHACRLTAAAVACLEMLGAAGELLVEAFEGPGAERVRGQVRSLAVAPLHQQVAVTGQPVVVADARVDDRAVVPGEAAGMPLGPVLVLPLSAGDHPIGALTIGAEPGRPPFTALEQEMTGLLAGHAALAVDLLRARRSGPQPVPPSTDRVAQSLHDVVMQRLFATGLQLQCLMPAVSGFVADKLAGAADNLDQTMADIRAAIVVLRRSGTDEDPNVQAALLKVAAEADRDRDR